MAIKFRPSDTKYTDYLLELVSKFALADWQQQQELEQYKKKLQLQRDIGLENLTKYKGLFPEAGGQEAGIPTSPFARQPISPAYMKGLDLETGMPQIGMRSPEDIRGLQFQQDVGRFKVAESEYGLGQGMTREKFRALPTGDRASFIKARMANFPGAAGAMKELRPRFEGKEFVQDVEGRYKEMPPQAITDAEGNIIGYRPKGAVFKPKGTEKVSYNPALTQKVIGNIKSQEDLNELLKNKSAYKEAGVDISEVIKSVLNTPVGKKNKGILQKLASWLVGG